MKRDFFSVSFTINVSYGSGSTQKKKRALLGHIIRIHGKSRLCVKYCLKYFPQVMSVYNILETFKIMYVCMFTEHMCTWWTQSQEEAVISPGFKVGEV